MHEALASQVHRIERVIKFAGVTGSIRYVGPKAKAPATLDEKEQRRAYEREWYRKNQDKMKAKRKRQRKYHREYLRAYRARKKAQEVA